MWKGGSQKCFNLSSLSLLFHEQSYICLNPHEAIPIFCLLKRNVTDKKSMSTLTEVHIFSEFLQLMQDPGPLYNSEVLLPDWEAVLLEEGQDMKYDLIWFYPILITRKEKEFMKQMQAW